MKAILDLIIRSLHLPFGHLNERGIPGNPENFQTYITHLWESGRSNDIYFDVPEKGKRIATQCIYISKSWNDKNRIHLNFIYKLDRSPEEQLLEMGVAISPDWSLRYWDQKDGSAEFVASIDDLDTIVQFVDDMFTKVYQVADDYTVNVVCRCLDSNLHKHLQ